MLNEQELDGVRQRNLISTCLIEELKGSLLITDYDMLRCANVDVTNLLSMVDELMTIIAPDEGTRPVLEKLLEERDRLVYTNSLQQGIIDNFGTEIDKVRNWAIKERVLEVTENNDRRSLWIALSKALMTALGKGCHICVHCGKGRSDCDAQSKTYDSCTLWEFDVVRYGYPKEKYDKMVQMYGKQWWKYVMRLFKESDDEDTGEM